LPFRILPPFAALAQPEPNRQTVIRSLYPGALAVSRGSPSLFLPVIEILKKLETTVLQRLFGILGRRLAVIFQNHPDIG
jgi:hypothetical protein